MKWKTFQATIFEAVMISMSVRMGHMTVPLTQNAETFRAPSVANVRLCLVVKEVI